MASEAPPPPSPPRRRRNPVLATLNAIVRTRVSTGLLVVLPIYITWIVVKFVFDLLRGSSQWLVDALLQSRWGQSLLGSWHVQPQEINASVWMRWGIGLFCVGVTIFVLYAVGLFAANVFGKRLIEAMERLLARLPLVKSVYSTLKQILATFSSGAAQTFKSAALVPFPTDKMRAIGFVTNHLRDERSGEELVTVFIPTTPNPTSGFFQVVRSSEIVVLPWTAEETLRTIMSAGILLGPGITLRGSNPPPGLDAGAARDGGAT